MRRMEYCLYSMHDIVPRWAEHVADVDDEGTVLLSRCVIKYKGRTESHEQQFFVK